MTGLLITSCLAIDNCGVKTYPTPLIRTKNELLEVAVRVEPSPTPTPQDRKQ